MTEARSVSGWRRLSGVLAATAITMFPVLAWLLISSPQGFYNDPMAGYICCVTFAAVATASAVTAARALGRPVTVIETVSLLALWALLPIAMFLFVWTVLIAGVFALIPVLFLVVPLLLADGARRVVRRGRMARATALLLISLMYTTGLLAILGLELPVAAWLPVMMWNLALALIAVWALGWDMHHGRA